MWFITGEKIASVASFFMRNISTWYNTKKVSSVNLNIIKINKNFVFNKKHAIIFLAFCVPERASIRSLCSTITGDANLFAMFRLDAAPIDCPFRAPMSFTYNKGQGECQNPVSSVDSCLQSSRILFNYQACPNVPGTESTG